MDIILSRKEKIILDWAVEKMTKYIIVIIAILLVLNVSDHSMKVILQQTAIIQNVILKKVISLLKVIQQYALMKVIKKNGKKN